MDIGFGTALVFDRCGKQAWTNWVNNLTEFHSGVVNASEQMFEAKWTTDASGVPSSPHQLSLLNFQGQILMGPKSGEGVPLTELWRVAIGPGCPAGQAVLDDSGVMYLVREGTLQAGGTVLVAIQTTSPGLAKSSWSNLRRDNEGRSWLAP